MEPDEADRGSQPDPIREQIGDEEDDFESDEDQGRSMVEKVAILYKDLREMNLDKDEYSKRHNFLDTLTTGFIRAAVLPDDEIDDQYTKALRVIPLVMGGSLADAVYMHHEFEAIEGDNQNIKLVLDWRFYFLYRLILSLLWG
jgi:hypothetical protein